MRTVCVVCGIEKSPVFGFCNCKTDPDVQERAKLHCTVEIKVTFDATQVPSMKEVLFNTRFNSDFFGDCTVDVVALEGEFEDDLKG